ncbi:hypothetical protein D3C75_685530 [compost metagenome]
MVLGHYLGDYGQPQATAAAGARHITLGKGLEHPGVVLLRDPGAIVREPQPDPVTIVLQLGLQPGRAVTQRIARQVVEDATDADGMAGHPHRLLRQ